MHGSHFSSILTGYAVQLTYAIFCRVSRYQDNMRGSVLEKAKRLEDLGWEEYLK
jgi:hypothetical protein